MKEVGRKRTNGKAKYKRLARKLKENSFRRQEKRAKGGYNTWITDL